MASQSRLLPLVAAIAFLALPLAWSAAGAGTSTVSAGAGCPSTPCLLWTQRADGPGDASATTGALSPDGSVLYVAGGHRTDTTSDDLDLRALDVATGATLWTATYDGPVSSSEGDAQDATVRRLAVSPDGETLVVAVASRGDDFSIDMATLAYATGDGSLLWEGRTAPVYWDDEGVAGVTVVDGAAVTAGHHEDRFTDRRDWLVSAHSLSSGAPLWTRMQQSPCGESLAFGVVPVGDLAVVAGYAPECVGALGQSQVLAYRFTAVAYDAQTGQEAWRSVHGDPLAVAASVLRRGYLVAGGDRIYAVGGLTAPGNPVTNVDVVAAAWDLAGSPLWSRRFDTGGSEYPMGAVAGPAGRLHLVAAAPGTPTLGVSDRDKDLVAVAIGPDGAPEWTRRFDDSALGFNVGARTLAGESREDTLMGLQPALVDRGSTLAFSYLRQAVPRTTLESFGTPAHVTVLLDAATGSSVSTLTETYGPVEEELAFVASPQRADFLGIGWGAAAGTTVAQVRRFTMDLQPPVLEVPAGLRLEAAGTSGASATFAARAHDGVDGPRAVGCLPASGSVLPLGTHTITCSASDLSGNRATAAFTAIVADTTPPALQLPGPLSVAATSSTGAHVAYTATAHDLVDGALPVACDPPPGPFPLGTTQVACAATDAAGNAAAGAFAVTVAYEWSGLVGPVTDGATLEAGRPHWVRFRLTGPSAGVTDAKAALLVLGPDGGEAPASTFDGQPDGFRYLGDGYAFLWNATRTAPGAYQLRVDLGDGVDRLAAVRLA
jgi:outer membrane protein assembly factor BamB